MTFRRVPWWWRFRLFSLRRKNVDVIVAQIKTLDSIYKVSKDQEFDGDQTRELIDRVISEMVKTLAKVDGGS